MIEIERKNYIKGADGYQTFSVRIKKETASSLDRLAAESNRSRNELINLFLEYSVNHIRIK